MFSKLFAADLLYVRKGEFKHLPHIVFKCLFIFKTFYYIIAKEVKYFGIRRNWHALFSKFYLWFVKTQLILQWKSICAKIRTNQIHPPSFKLPRADISQLFENMFLEKLICRNVGWYGWVFIINCPLSCALFNSL